MIRLLASLPLKCCRLFFHSSPQRMDMLALSALAAVVVSLLGSLVQAEAGDLPNIVVILVDDMGYGDPQCYNPQSKIPTPNIDSLARDGMRFTDAHASGPLCHMSRYGLLTGRYPFRTDVSLWRKQPLIKSGEVTIASILKSAGYRTSMVGKWHLGFDESGGYGGPLPGGPVDCGFDSYFGIRASTDIPPYFYIRGDRAVSPPTDQIAANDSEGWTPIQGAFWRSGGIAPDLKLKDVLPRFTDEAIRVIDAHAGDPSDQPLMLYLAYPAPHTPWLPSAEFDGKSGASMYGDFLMMVDSMIGRVLGALDRADMSKETLVIFSSDNGPVWYEEDVRRFGHDSSGGLRGMKADAWECGHRMPFIARWPGKVAAGSSSDQTICFTDLLATFASIVEKPLPQGAGPDSFDVSPALLGTATGPIRDSLVIRSAGKTMTIRAGKWKLIDSLGSGGFSNPKKVQPGPGDPQGQLYDLSADIGETDNQYLSRPELVRKLKAKLVTIRDAGHHRPDFVSP